MKRFSQTIKNVREHFSAWVRVPVILLILFCIFFIAGGGISQNLRWHIDTIDIQGTNTETLKIVRSIIYEKLEGNYFFVYARSNSYMFPKKEIEKTLLEIFPRIKNINVERSDDHTLFVDIVEREPYALWCGEVFHPELSSFPDCWFIDSTGFVFDKAPTFSRGVYREVYGKLIEKHKGDSIRGILPSESFVTLDTFSTLIKEKIGKVFQIQLKPNDELSVTIKNSATYPFFNYVSVCFNKESDPPTLIKNLLTAIPVQFPENVALKKELQYIDMRFNNKIIFGFDPNASSTCLY